MFPTGQFTFGGWSTVTQPAIITVGYISRRSPLTLYILYIHICLYSYIIIYIYIILVGGFNPSDKY